MDMQIRSLVMDDIQSLEHLMKQLGYPSPIEQLHARFQTLLSLRDYKTFVAEQNGKIVGFIGMAKQYAYEFNDPYVRILALVVDEQYRRQHIGQKLIATAEEWARHEGGCAIVLNSGNRQERKVAHQFYEQLGYKSKSTGFFKYIEGSELERGNQHDYS